MISLVISFRHIIEALLHNAKALAHFFHPHYRTVETIAVMCNGNFKVKHFISRVRLLFPEVKIKSTGTQTRTGNAPFKCLFQSIDADTFCTGFEKTVADHHVVILPELFGKIGNKITNQLIPAFWQILCYAANTKPVGVHSPATDRLDDIEYFFTIGKHVKYGRQLPEILRKCAKPNQVTVDAE